MASGIFQTTVTIPMTDGWLDRFVKKTLLISIYRKDQIEALRQHIAISRCDKKVLRDLPYKSTSDIASAIKMRSVHLLDFAFALVYWTSDSYEQFVFSIALFRYALISSNRAVGTIIDIYSSSTQASRELMQAFRSYGAYVDAGVFKTALETLNDLGSLYAPNIKF